MKIIRIFTELLTEWISRMSPLIWVAASSLTAGWISGGELNIVFGICFGGCMILGPLLSIWVKHLFYKKFDRKGK